MYVPLMNVPFARLHCCTRSNNNNEALAGFRKATMKEAPGRGMGRYGTSVSADVPTSCTRISERSAIPSNELCVAGRYRPEPSSDVTILAFKGTRTDVRPLVVLG
jgi:hypothetical protein